jgi:hypothetical protein
MDYNEQHNIENAYFMWVVPWEQYVFGRLSTLENVHRYFDFSYDLLNVKYKTIKIYLGWCLLPIE